MALTSKITTRTALTREEFEELYRRERSGVYSYALGLVRDPATAEDIAQSAFLKAWKKRRSFNPARGSDKSWLYQITRNTALDELRRQSRHAIPSENIPEAITPEKEDLSHVREKVLTLPLRDRELVVLRYWAELSTKEIAQMTDLTPSNVSTRLARALQSLQDVLKEDD